MVADPRFAPEALFLCFPLLPLRYTLDHDLVPCPWILTACPDYLNTYKLAHWKKDNRRATSLRPSSEPKPLHSVPKP